MTYANMNLINNKKVKMRQNILNEELGISNAVNSLVIRLKNLISNNYSKNNDDTKKYVLLGGVNKYIVFTNTISVSFENKDIEVEYYVLSHKSEKTKQSFIKEYHSNCSNEILKITLYLTLNNNNDKIDWLSCSLDLQHEVEHLFQLYKKEKPIFSNKKIEKYNNLKKLTSSDNFYDQVIGYTYYYYERVEKNAIMNGIYRKIIDTYIPGYKGNPMDDIENTPYYTNIQIIKNTISEEKNWDKLENRLNLVGKTLKQFLRISKQMIIEYEKAFGRLLYKLNKDIKERNNQYISEHFGEIINPNE